MASKYGGWMMNREALPLLVGIILPISLVLVIVLYLYGYDVTYFFRRIDLIYYIIIFPIILGFLIAVSRVKKVD